MIAFDLETYLIEGCRSPKPVSLAWYGAWGWTEPSGVKSTGDEGGLEAQLERLIDAGLAGEILIGQNLTFDLGCIFWWYPKFRSKIFRLLELESFRDTMIREKLFALSTTGRVDECKASLADLVSKYLGRDISKFKKGEDVWRLRYSELDGIPVALWPKEATDYALLDVELTYKVFKAQSVIFRKTGYGSAGTEGLQIKSAFSLQLITQRGILLNQAKLLEIEKQTQDILAPLGNLLVEKGFAWWNKEFKLSKRKKKLQEHLLTNFSSFIKVTEKSWAKFKKEFSGVELDEALLDVDLKGAESVYFNKLCSAVKVDGSSLEEIPGDEIINSWLSFMEHEKILTTYLPRLKGETYVYPPYRNLKETGRTSSYCTEKFPSINIQQIPRDGQLRNLFIPRTGFLMGTVDYHAIELACVADRMYNLFGDKSEMYRIINSGDKPVDMHAYVGSALYAADLNINVNFDDFCKLKTADPPLYKKYRNRGKPIGLGYFGGLGEETMVMVAKGQGVSMTVEDALAARSVHAKLFPEIVYYIGYRDKRDWKLYPDLKEEKGWVRNQLVDNGYWGYSYDCNGRYRGGCTYCSCANGFSMQSPAADGFKEAIFRCVRACYDPSYLGGQLNGNHVIAEIHDELVFELKEDGNEKLYLEKFEELMIEGMQTSIKNVRVTVEGSLSRMWDKKEENHLWTNKKWKDAKSLSLTTSGL